VVEKNHHFCPNLDSNQSNSTLQRKLLKSAKRPSSIKNTLIVLKIVHPTEESEKKI
jgi:hypothetical protein